jgi:hypothetical protein
LKGTFLVLIGSSLDEPLEELLEEPVLEVEFVEEELFVVEEFVRLFEDDEGCIEVDIELLGVTITNWQPTSNIVISGVINIFFI